MYMYMHTTLSGNSVSMYEAGRSVCAQAWMDVVVGMVVAGMVGCRLGMVVGVVVCFWAPIGAELACVLLVSWVG